MTPQTDLYCILAAYDLHEQIQITPIPGGLINRTFLLTTPNERLVLQWVNPIFDPQVHLDIEAVTAHLAAQGMLTPRLRKTTSGALYTRDQEGGVWRVLTFIPGKTLHRVENPASAHAAGALLGRFHKALSTLTHQFAFSRAGVHDTPKHLARLSQALEERRDHPRYEAVAPVAEQILARAGALEPLPTEPLRIVHGDPKISNLIFDENLSEGKALLDLDTLAYMTIPVELGDAFRSWCNPAGEDESAAAIQEPLFAAAVQGYASVTRGWLTPEEIGALVLGTQTIALELASRFCADALYESYFGWDPSRFSSRSEHNLARAKSQLAVAASVEQKRGVLASLVKEAFSG